MGVPPRAPRRDELALASAPKKPLCERLRVKIAIRRSKIGQKGCAGAQDDGTSRGNRCRRQKELSLAWLEQATARIQLIGLKHQLQSCALPTELKRRSGVRDTGLLWLNLFMQNYPTSNHPKPSDAFQHVKTLISSHKHYNGRRFFWLGAAAQCQTFALAWEC